MAKYKIYLVGGQVIDVVCPEDEVWGINEQFDSGEGFLVFDNGKFRVDHVSGLEYVE